MELCNVSIRPALPEDAAALLEIYAPYVRETAISFEYAVPDLETFRGRIENTLKKYPYLAAESAGEILGYAYLGPFKTRDAYSWAVETTIYLKQGLGRQGLGRRLYEALEAVAAAQHITNFNACIASPPEEGDAYVTRNSIAFHAHMGYRLVGEFRQCGYKFGRWYNMVWMEKHISAHVPRPEPVIPFPELPAETLHRCGIS